MRIKELREEKQISQKKLAEIIGTSQRNIGRWENEENEPSYLQIVKLADFFEVSVDYLIGREDDIGNITISGQSTDQNLSPNEEELLELFNKLNLFEQDSILVQVRALAEKHKVRSK